MLPKKKQNCETARLYLLILSICQFFRDVNTVDIDKKNVFMKILALELTLKFESDGGINSVTRKGRKTGGSRAYPSVSKKCV